ncbi:SCO family protein [Pedobacter changchengzhani]|uniref:SCO family protein n=1 Tax=Pedobacter changchengzhani TaxID=2529274 RepID=UPI001FB672E6|nr:SCO family protein [Pedobacter changchengzhani]
MPHYAKNRYKRLPFFGEKQVASTFRMVRGDKIPDTVYHEVPDFNFENQKGDTISWDQYKDKLIIINLFYVNSPITVANQNLKKIATGYLRNKLIHFISISVDPSDHQKQLGEYAAKMNLPADKWNFLSGDTTSVYRFVRKGLLLDVVDHQKDAIGKIIYSNEVLLLDNQHRIRGFYDATNDEAMSKLDDEIKVLVAEDLRGIKDGR